MIIDLNSRGHTFNYPLALGLKHAMSNHFLKSTFDQGKELSDEIKLEL